MTTLSPITVTVHGHEDLPVGSTVRVEVTIELGPSSTVSTSTTTINQGETITGEVELTTDSDEDEPPITVMVCDTHTGVRVESSKYPYYWWTEGNGSCDCNRELLFGPDTSRGVCLGNHRYLIIRTSYGSLAELNNGYSPERLAHYDIPTVQA